MKKRSYERSDGVETKNKVYGVESVHRVSDNTTEEEKLLMKVRTFCSQPRIMALMDEVTIQ